MSSGEYKADNWEHLNFLFRQSRRMDLLKHDQLLMSTPSNTKDSGSLKVKENKNRIINY